MNILRTHDRTSFFKHVTASTAKLILKNVSLRWSMPGLFNDPFDVPREMFSDLDETKIHNALIDRMNALVLNPVLPNPEHYSEMTKELLSVISIADAATRQRLIDGNELYRLGPKRKSEAIEEWRQLWRTLYREQRIVCFTERWDSASMWDRYSDGHRGVVLEFGCKDELDSAWLLAKPVRYSDEPLRMNTAEGLAEAFFYAPKFATSTLLSESMHTKTTDWAYEKEWRVASWKRKHETGDYSDYEFLPQELQSVTLGASISLTDEQVLIGSIKEKYPHVMIWKASVEGSGRRLSRTEYAL